MIRDYDYQTTSKSKSLIKSNHQDDVSLFQNIEENLSQISNDQEICIKDSCRPKTLNVITKE